MKFTGLFIDIDDTLLRRKANIMKEKWAGSLKDVLKSAGAELGGLPAEESAARVEWVNKNVKWWDWGDFIAKLEIDPDAFWGYALSMERAYLEPTEANLPATMQELRESGLELFITSNNPNSGIRHKLRLAGFTDADIDDCFTALLGATEMRSMKWEPEFWRKALAESNLPKEKIAVVGDSVNDDHHVPSSIGLPFTFLIDPLKSQPQSEKLKPVANLREVADHLAQATGEIV